jgi:formylglycine-generating enzyme required for sulfatase activity
MHPIHTSAHAASPRPNLLQRTLGAAVAALALAFAAAPAAHAQTACDADVNTDGVVDSADLGALLSEWGPCKSCTADLNGDNEVDSADLGALLSLWGAPCQSLPWATVLEFAPNPAVVTNATLRDAITATGFPWRVRDNGTQIEMLLVPPGTFNMGCSASNQTECFFYEYPVHAVTLTNAFYIGRYEVTQAQWTATMGSNPSFFQSASAQVPAEQVPNRPVDQVSWNTIQGFLFTTGLRLPTEAEWEYAYRAGTTTAFHSMPGFPNGTNDDNQVGNIAWRLVNSDDQSGNSADQTRPVGGKSANALGLHDMAGNVWEWVNDRWDVYSPAAQTNPPGPATGLFRVLRGGSWANAGTYLRSSFRADSSPDFTPGVTNNSFGFRVAKSATAPALTSVTPNSGPTSGGTTITLTGTNLAGTTSVTIGGAAASGVTVVNATTVTAVTPPGLTGAQTVSITTPNGTANLPNGFIYTGVWYTVLEQNPNPAVVTDGTLRNAITATGLPWRVRDNASQIEMLLVPPGTFNMGCSASNAFACVSDGRESPVHAVTLTNAFYIGRYEVTQAQWTARMGSNPSSFQSASAQVPAAQVPNRPVEQVSWTTIQGFLSATGLRLPTEAEWEYAYRAGTTTAFHSMPGFPNGTNDDTQVGNIAWRSSNSTSQTRPVGGKAANALGLHDMSGNVWEWVNDRYSSTYYASSPSTNPPGPASGSSRVRRGGSWDNDTNSLRSSFRASNSPGNTFNYCGFRVARAPL